MAMVLLFCMVGWMEVRSPKTEDRRPKTGDRTRNISMNPYNQ